MNEKDSAGSSDSERLFDSEAPLSHEGESASKPPFPPLTEGSSNGFSLDAFEISDEGDPGLKLKGSQKEPLAHGEASDSPTVHTDRKRPSLNRLRVNRKILFGSIGLLTFLSASTGVYWFWGAQRPESPPIVTHIRKPVPIPQYKETAEFFLLADAQSERNILSLTLEFEFRSSGAFERCKDESVLFRDMVYRFLQTGKPAKNTQKAWSQIIQNDLPVHLKTQLSGMSPEIIRIQRFEKL